MARSHAIWIVVSSAPPMLSDPPGACIKAAFTVKWEMESYCQDLDSQKVFYSVLKLKDGVR